ncbi:hypothetical protein KZZ52_51635 [Dactylosporangium sp. AC04546]|uniref:hypothetical protein n=1 Tax=Dactylosporangium sp. AC04546 TaxID=2862460 RepID=UPI001EDFC7F1|nr:hypothetical protein [Dactylosporangium sp. AC04546]WVK82314.1 hypothetical protein KZZ52_51635 [Dactylosporangium sp. AC04546]
MEKWVAFRRSRIDRVVAMVRAVAEAADPGEHGEGVEVVVEAPRKKWWQALFNRDDTLAQARIVVTRAGGEVRYPFDIQLVTAYGGNAAHRLGTRPGWAVSNSAGMAFVIQKGTHRTAFDFEELTTGAVAALARLRRKPQERGWRARVDRAVRRS